MKAVLCQEFGAIDNLVLDEIPSPSIGAGQVKIRVRACGVNFPDILLVQGSYQLKPPLPFSPGLEIAGDISEIGEGVDGLQIGQRVVSTLMWGGFAEEVVAPGVMPMPIAAGLSYEEAAAIPLAYGTAHVALTHRAELKPGETLLVLGAAGGVGLAAVQLGALLGARVIAAASTTDKLELARKYGADDLINYSSESLRDRMKALTDGRGADVIFDPVGGDLFDQALRRIAWEGRYLVIGFASGRIPSAPVNIALLKNASIVGLFWGAYWQHDSAVIRRSFEQLMAWSNTGEIKPRIHKTFPLEGAVSALRELQERRVMGKVVIAAP